MADTREWDLDALVLGWAKEFVRKASGGITTWDMLSPRGQVDAVRRLAAICGNVEKKIRDEAHERAQQAQAHWDDLRDHK
jgi:hypothetical protein